jgi:hypothetical protein
MANVAPGRRACGQVNPIPQTYQSQNSESVAIPIVSFGAACR